MNKLFLHLNILILSTILFGCDAKDPVQDHVQEKDEPVNFRLIDCEPAWSPDGKWIAFQHEEYGKWGIYLISPDGANIRKLHDGFASTPSWSPDGQWITFSEYDKIWKMKINGDSLTQLTFEGRNFYPSWSPDGQWIAFDNWIPDDMKFYGISKIKNNGNEKTLIRYDIHEGDMRMPTWLNDSTIIYARYSPLFYSTEIFSMDSNGKNDIRLTFNNASDQYSKCSHNRITFISKPNDKLYISIWAMDKDGSNLKQLTNTQSYACDWSPDGKNIVYTDASLENGRLWIMDASGNNKRQLTFENHFRNF
jgi:TolB protein